MKKDRKLLIKIASVYSLIVMLFMLVPFYLYIDESVSNLKTQELTRAKKEAAALKLSICITNNIETSTMSTDNIQVIFLNDDDEMVFSNIATPISEHHDYREGIFGNEIYVFGSLEKKRDGATKFIVINTIDYSGFIFKTIILILYILVFLLLSSGALVYFSTKTLAESNKHIARFFDDAMHEIRTPIGIIQINLDMLSETIKKSSSPLLIRTQAAVKSLTSIYEDVEYFIKYEKVDFKPEEIDISKFIKSRVEFFNSCAEVREIAISHQIEKELKVNMNRLELQRVIDNTMTNAIKYSKEDTNISINLSSEDKYILFSVKDEGIGISDISKIFTRHYRGETIKGGFGIGLSIVKSICTKYNIQTKVISKPGKGSTFSYKFLQI